MEPVFAEVWVKSRWTLLSFCFLLERGTCVVFSSLCFQNLLSDVGEGVKEENLIRTCFLVLLSLGGLGRGC